MKKRIIHDLSDEDLIALVKGISSEEVVMEKLSEASKFIYALDIKNGDTKIPAALIYHTYKCWKGWDQKRQSKPMFFRDFKKYFEPCRTNTEMCYLLNPKPFDLSEETYWLIKKEHREAKAKKTKKTSG